MLDESDAYLYEKVIKKMTPDKRKKKSKLALSEKT